MEQSPQKDNLFMPLVRSFLLSCLLIVVTGCTPPLMLALGAGAVGGYAIGRDTFEGMTSKGQDEIWDAAQRVVSIMGLIDSTDKRKGEIYGRIQGAHVTVSILPVNLTTTKIRIKARQHILPKVAIAQEVYTKIINQLE